MERSFIIPRSLLRGLGILTLTRLLYGYIARCSLTELGSPDTFQIPEPACHLVLVGRTVPVHPQRKNLGRKVFGIVTARFKSLKGNATCFNIFLPLSGLGCFFLKFQSLGAVFRLQGPVPIMFLASAF
jgi:hypothetical protein